jgi:hypothetical protein
MLEILDAYQSLEYTLDLRDRLERATDPLEVPALIAEAIRAIVGEEREGQQHLAIRLSDRLEDVLTRVTAAYKAVVIPGTTNSGWRRHRKS